MEIVEKYSQRLTSAAAASLEASQPAGGDITAAFMKAAVELGWRAEEGVKTKPRARFVRTHLLGFGREEEHDEVVFRGQLLTAPDGKQYLPPERVLLEWQFDPRLGRWVPSAKFEGASWSNELQLGNPSAWSDGVKEVLAALGHVPVRPAEPVVALPHHGPHVVEEAWGDSYNGGVWQIPLLCLKSEAKDILDRWVEDVLAAFDEKDNS